LERESDKEGRCIIENVHMMTMQTMAEYAAKSANTTLTEDEKMAYDAMCNSIKHYMIFCKLQYKLQIKKMREEHPNIDEEVVY